MKNYEENEYSNGKPFGVFISGLGQYNEGMLTGKWLYLPANNHEWKDAMEEAGIGTFDQFRQPYEEYFISDTDVYVPGLKEHIGEYSNLEVLQLLAEKIEEMDDSDYKAFCAYLEVGEVSTLDEVYSLASQANELNGNNLYIYSGVEDNYDLGRYCVEDLAGGLEYIDKDTRESCFNYEALGRDLSFDSYDVDNYKDYEEMFDNECHFDISFRNYNYKDNPENIDLEEVLNKEKGNFRLIVEGDDLSLNIKIEDVHSKDELVEHLSSILQGPHEILKSGEETALRDIICALNEYDPNGEYRYENAGDFWCGDRNASNQEIGEAYIADIGISGVSNEDNYFDYKEYGRQLEMKMQGEYTNLGYVEIVDDVNFGDELKNDLKEMQENKTSPVPSFNDMVEYRLSKKNDKDSITKTMHSNKSVPSQSKPLEHIK